jgi:hypothetical protein
MAFMRITPYERMRKPTAKQRAKKRIGRLRR